MEVSYKGEERYPVSLLERMIAMADFPSSFTEEWQMINGRGEPITTFLPDKVFPVTREGNEDLYAYTKDRLETLEYHITNFDKEIMQIHRIGEKSPVFCKTAMLVGACKGTWGDEAFSQCIEAMFRCSSGDRAARQIAIDAKKIAEMRKMEQPSE
jgi:hypothetical protein